jgi:NIMA (never in mitosis gene a)-related kinase 1/4/5
VEHNSDGKLYALKVFQLAVETTERDK